MKKVLLIAFHFPPVKTSSGIQRTLRFATYLPEFGWHPAVLSVAERAYPTVMDDQMGDIPAGLEVSRVWALDSARHLAVGGSYLGATAIPDRWVSWVLGGMTQGRGFVRRFMPDVMVSTYPIASAHLLAYLLHRATGIPWVADCRDSMTEPGYPREKLRRRMFLWIERRMVAHAARVVFTTEGTRRMYAERYPDVPPEKWAVIENGYDEENFRNATAAGAPPNDGRVTIVHSGVVYPSERDPTALFAATAALKADGFFARFPTRIVLRATGHDELYAPRLAELDIADVIELAPAIGYESALSEMLAADGLLLMQGANCNHQIPAKVYEYLRAGRPVLGLTAHEGDTAGVMRAAGLGTIAALDDSAEIERVMRAFIERVSAGDATVPDPAYAERCSRRLRTRELAELLEGIVS